MKYSEFYRLLKKDGWYDVRQDGTSHKVMRHPTKTNQLTFPYHGAREIGKDLENKLKKQAGLK